MTCAVSATCDITTLEHSVGFLCSNPESVDIHSQREVCTCFCIEKLYWCVHELSSVGKNCFVCLDIRGIWMQNGFVLKI